MAILQFWGPNRFLSNFYFSPVEYEGLLYRNVECAYQAAKTFDESERLKIRAATPKKAKHFGRRVTLREDWEDVKLEIMETLLREKFKHEGMRFRLLNTGDEHLEEGNTWGDKFWGTVDGQGENHLGKLLMKIREEIRNEIANSERISQEQDG